MNVRLRIIFILSVLLLAPAVSAQDLADDYPARQLAFDLLEEGYSQYDSGNYQEALKYLHLSTALDSTYKEAFYITGNCYYMLDSIPSALAAYNKLLTMDPFNVEATTLVGRCLLRLNRPEEAESAMRLAVRLERAPQTYIALAQTLQTLKKDSAADVAYRNAIERDSSDIDSWASYGQFLNKIKRYEDAVRVLEEAFDIDSTSQTVVEQLGLAETALRNWEFAAQWFEKLGSMNGDSLTIAAMIHAIWTKADRKDEAARYLHIVEKGTGSPEQLHTRLAMGWLRLNFLQEGIEEAKRSEAANADYAPAQYLLMNAYLQLDDEQNACIHYRRLAELNPKGAEMVRAQLIDEVDLDDLCSGDDEDE